MSTTANYSFTLPTVGGDIDSWGTPLNANWTSLDGLLGGGSPVTGIDIDSGSADNVVIGDTNPAAGSFTALSTTGNATFGGNLTFDAANPSLSFSGTVSFIGGTTYTFSGGINTGDIGIIGTATIADIDVAGGEIDGTVVGGSIPAAGTFTNITASGLSSLSNVDINGGNIDGTAIGGTTPSTGSFTSVDIDGGSIDNATIGGATPAAATVTTLTVNTSASLGSSVGIDGGTIDGTVIGGTTPAAGTFTDHEIQGLRKEGVHTITGTSPSLEPSNGPVQVWTLTADSTATQSFGEGERMLLLVDGAGFNVTSWPAITEWLSDGGSPPTLLNGRYTPIDFVRVGTDLLAWAHPT